MEFYKANEQMAFSEGSLQVLSSIIQNTIPFRQSTLIIRRITHLYSGL